MKAEKHLQVDHRMRAETAHQADHHMLEVSLNYCKMEKEKQIYN
jgi:hypothetical protein